MRRLDCWSDAQQPQPPTPLNFAALFLCRCQQRAKERRRASFDEERQRVLSFVKAFAPYDWTAELDGGEHLNKD